MLPFISSRIFLAAPKNEKNIIVQWKGLCYFSTSREIYLQEVIFIFKGS